jgi:uncharacterized membrane protein required for colicin V production
VNWVDIVIIVVAALGAYTGLKQGLVRTVFTVAGLFIGVTIAGQYSDNLADKLSSGGAQWASIVAFILIVLIVMVVANLMGGIVKTFLKVMLMGWLDSLGGMVLGLIAGALVISALFTIVLQWEGEASELPIAGAIAGDKLSFAADAIRESSLASFFIDKFRLVLGLLPGRFDVVTEFFE